MQGRGKAGRGQGGRGQGGCSPVKRVHKGCLKIQTSQWWPLLSKTQKHSLGNELTLESVSHSHFTSLHAGVTV